MRITDCCGCVQADCTGNSYFYRQFTFEFFVLSTSFESANSLEELKQNDDSLVKSSALGDMDDETPSSTVLPDVDGGSKFDSEDSNEPPVAAAAPGNASLPTSQITEGLKKLSLGELGRALSPPLRKIWAPNLKRDSDFSPLKEEEGDACVDSKEAPIEVRILVWWWRRRVVSELFIFVSGIE